MPDKNEGERGTMFRVECEGCNAPYQVDERRIPTGGMKMRCPKCGTTFSVSAPAGEADLPTAAAAGERAVAAPRPMPTGTPMAKGTMVGLGAGTAPPAPLALDDLPEIDLPLPAGARAPAPGPVGGAKVLPPRPPPAAPPAPFGQLDLEEAPDLWDLPSTAQSDLPARPAAPAPAPAPRGAPPRAAPPRPPAPAPPPSAGDLPAVLVPGLPAVPSAGLPLRAAQPAGLPVPATALPVRAPAGPSGLPAAVRGGLPANPAGLPVTLAAGLPSNPAAGLPAGSGAGLPAPRAFGEIDLPLLGELPEPHLGVASGPVAGPVPGGPTLPDLDAFDLRSEPPDGARSSRAPQPSRARSASPGQLPGGGATAFGEVDLDAGEEAEIGLDGPTGPSKNPLPPSAATPDEDMEFGGIPQKADGGGAAASAAKSVSLRPIIAESAQVRRSSRSEKKPTANAVTGGRVVAGLVALAAIGGASLEVLTPFGAFGRHVITDFVNRDKYAALEVATVDAARRALGADTYGQATRAAEQLDQARASAPRILGLPAYGAFVGYMTELRFGRVPEVDAHAKALFGDVLLEDTRFAADLARGAQAAVLSQLPRARQIVEALAKREPKNADVGALSGEIELLAKEPQKAVDAWKGALANDGGSARTTFGLARALWAAGDAAGALDYSKKVLDRSQNHVAARVLVARALWISKHDEVGALQMLTEVTSPGPIHDGASAVELVDALTLQSAVHMARSRMTQAEASLSEAIKIDPKAAAALAGMGELLYREGRFTDALARFEAGVQADPDGPLAKIGAAKTKIALERLQDAKDSLKKLRDARPGDLDVVYWLGRAEEALGDKDAALAAYQDGVKVGAQRPEAVTVYVALAQLLASEGRGAEAEGVLADARKKLPDSTAIHLALGDVNLTAGRYDAAKDEYLSALRLDAADLEARFKLGVTLRRMNKFDESNAAFDAVGAADKEYPGLALERGLLYEGANRTHEALEYYQQALSRAPDDPDMMLRVGSAEVVSGKAAQAEEILRKVISKRPNSAEVNHFLGRALLLKGTNLAEALRYLQRAVEIDGNRAEYHLYLGWAANDAGQPALAQQELTRAIALDKSLADAYWQLGVLLRKQGAVIDAVKNLQKAIELRPSRFEAFATLAECYEDENRTQDAITAFHKAISADDGHAEWHYRLGKLLGRAGLGELHRAITLGAALETKPLWLNQAYFEIAEDERAGGRRQEAILHYRQFLTDAKSDSPYRADAMKALQSLGAPYETP